MRVAFDIDDTITLCPEFFALISKALMDAGHDVFIISYRMDQQATEEELRNSGIVFREVLLLGDTGDECTEVDFYEWKAEMCRKLKIDIFFEDMPEVINELDDSTIAFMPVDRSWGRVEYQESDAQDPS